MINHDKAAVDACTPQLVFHGAVVLLLFESLVVDTLLWILQNSSLLVRPLCNPEVLFQALRRYAAVTPNRPEATWKTGEHTGSSARKNWATRDGWENYQKVGMQWDILIY
jgi:hypothetical protein